VLEKKKTEPTDIARWCVNHDKAYLLDEWVGMADDGTKLDINKITYGSKVKALWKCKYNHTWFARPNDR
jgi:hypothetical protein